MEANGSHALKHHNTTDEKHDMPPRCSCGVTKVFGRLGNLIWLKTATTPRFLGVFFAKMQFKYKISENMTAWSLLAILAGADMNAASVWEDVWEDSGYFCKKNMVLTSLFGLLYHLDDST